MIDKYYKILGVKKSSTKEEIKNSFKKLCHVYHPDKEGGDTQKFVALKKAYDYLIKNHVRCELEEKTYPYWKDGWVYYWPGDTGSYVGEED